VRLESPPAVTDQQRALAAAAERSWPASPDPLIAPCPLAKKKAMEPLRVLSWHIPDLGGGLHRSIESHERIIAAYAALLDGLAIDVCIVLGVRDSLGDMPEVVGSGKQAYVEMRPSPPDRGAAEIERVVAKLGSPWQAAFPRRASNGKILYCGGTTVAVLHRGLPAPTVAVADVTPRPALGVGGKLVCASFDVPRFRDGPLVLAASLSPERVAPPDARDRDLTATTSLPGVCLLAVSAAEPLDRAGELAALSSAAGARYRMPRDEGSDLDDGFWDRTLGGTSALVRNFLACNPADVDGQDAQMHWQCLPPPAHPKAHDEVFGRLRDTLLVCDRERSAPCRIDELRVVDLLAAMLPDLQRPAPERPDLPQEAGRLAAQLDDRRAARARPSQRSPSNDLAEARAFADELSPHSPIVAQLQYRAPT
jgi:hypothetical protein